MPNARQDPAPIEGFFRPTRRAPTPRYLLLAAALSPALIAAGIFLAAWLLIVAGIAAGLLPLIARRYSRRQQQVLVSLAAETLSVRGGGYDITALAPFRFKTGVERNAAAGRQPERCFLRMVLDAHGRPLVFEELVPAGYIPPPLAEITGLSSALGMAELTSLSPYPGTLWALIERMESLQASNVSSARTAEIESLYRIGRQELAEKQPDAAIETFSAIIRQQADAPEAYFNRAAARYAANRDLPKALNDLTTALRLNPGQYQAFRLRGLIHARQGNWAGLRDDCSAAINVQPKRAELYHLRGMACYQLQDFEAAAADFDLAIQLEPERHESYYNRGLTRRKQGDLAGALADFQAALRLHPASPEAQRELEALQAQMEQSQLIAES